MPGKGRKDYTSSALDEVMVDRLNVIADKMATTAEGVLRLSNAIQLRATLTKSMTDNSLKGFLNFKDSFEFKKSSATKADGSLYMTPTGLVLKGENDSALYDVRAVSKDKVDFSRYKSIVINCVITGYLGGIRFGPGENINNAKTFSSAVKDGNKYIFDAAGWTDNTNFTFYNSSTTGETLELMSMKGILEDDSEEDIIPDFTEIFMGKWAGDEGISEYPVPADNCKRFRVVSEIVTGITVSSWDILTYLGEGINRVAILDVDDNILLDNIENNGDISTLDTAAIKVMVESDGELTALALRYLT